ncbi:T9SS type A sorting domain-containing protein [Hymenobacter glacialis]|uniref:Secretion system C-terminal sorting domain-containing protein n=1 Tax=Hymenobacter glacialis TaxID=1908236 RepID=A0A1G1T5M6_9BACT|nr:T9SS type A sorting domain-containing protein [Hymenobacter glacialis]OGX86165.1 hypothetical protein BEN48_13370 [Hymenobacter glacialis]
MKKTLLFLGLLGFAGPSYAQVTGLGPWVEVNTVNFSTKPPGYVVRDIKTVAPNVAWAVTEEASQTGIANSFVKTKNAAGTEFSFGNLTAPGASAGFEASNISSVDAAGLVAVAAMYPTEPGEAGGELLRTTNGGATWTKVTTAAQFAPAAGGFCNWVHMFNATEGVALGDPINNSFEILRTTDGGVTWARLTANIPAPLAGEFGWARSFFARGNTIWAGTGANSSSKAVRVLKSTDKGLTWTASAPTTLLGYINRLAFKDDLNGIAYNVEVNAAQTAIGAVNLIRTADGGATWSPITQVNSNKGSFFYQDIDAVDGRYYSAGTRFPAAAPLQAGDLGTSFSIDGVNWTQISSDFGFTALDVISGSGTNSLIGYSGFVTEATGAGGVFKASSVVAATRDAALQGVLRAYPNPSQTGVFRVETGAFLNGAATLTVVDALGRQVRAQALTPAAVASKGFNLDLSSEPPGIYTIQISTATGIATQKLVMQ